MHFLVVFAFIISILQVALLSHQYQKNVGISFSVTPHLVRKPGKMKSTFKFSIPSHMHFVEDGREVRHLMFLKVHKAASGTVTSLIFRFGITRNLTFVLPRQFNVIAPFETIKDDLVYPRLNRPFDIMSSHVIFDKMSIEKYLHNDTMYIGIMRDPYRQFKSSMNYFHQDYVLNISRTNPVQEYLKHPSRYERGRKPRFSWLNNRQSVEYGFPDDVIISRNQSKIDDFIQKLDKELHLVLIAEYLDESLVLMRRLFNWGIQDIVYRSLHVRGSDRETTKPRAYDRRRYKKWASVDYALYNFFVKRLWKQIKLEFEFFDEVLHFRQIRMEVDDFCKLTTNTSDVYTVPTSKWNSIINIDSQFCKLLYAEEEDYIKMIAGLQYGIKLTT